MDVNNNQNDDRRHRGAANADTVLRRGAGTGGGTANSTSVESVLPYHTLVESLKRLVQMWAAEEQLLGNNNVHCKFAELELQNASKNS